MPSAVGYLNKKRVQSDLALRPVLKQEYLFITKAMVKFYMYNFSTVAITAVDIVLICYVAQDICSYFGHFMKSYNNHAQISPKSGPVCATFNLAKEKLVSYVPLYRATHASINQCV